MARLRSKSQAKKRGLTAFILSGGGNRGASQVGMLSALVEHDIYPDMILGASVGALNGVSFATDPSRATLARLNDLWMHVNKDVLLPPHRFGNAWRYAQRRAYVYSNDSLEAILRANIDIVDLSHTVIPMEIVVTNSLTGAPLRISSGDPIRALLATAALPGALPQIEFEGELYIDGGISDDVPLLRAAELGASSIYVLYCGTMDRGGRNRSRPIEAVLDSFALAKLARLRADLKTLGDAAKVTVIQSGAAQSVPWLDFGHAREIIQDGYRSANAVLADPWGQLPQRHMTLLLKKPRDFVPIHLQHHD